MIRVVVVDDSAFVRQALSRMLRAAGDIEVVGTAVDGQDGLEKVCALRPDVVTLDVKMPRMGGLEALGRIMAECPTAVLLLSSLTSDGGEITLRGLELGAMDFVDKGSVPGQMDLLSLSGELSAKVRALAAVPRDRLARPPATAPAAPPLAPRRATDRAEIVAIGTSTGGPPALQAIVPRLPASLTAPILIVQHMPAGFTRSLAERLDQRSRIRVREAEDGEPLRPGVALVAPAGRHLKVVRRGGDRCVSLQEEPRGLLHRPSIDVLMASVAQAYGRRSLAVLLTGMGADGVEGMRAVRAAGGRTLAESEDTAVIFGMPKAAIDAGVVDQAVPLPRIADEILAAV